MTSTYFAQNRFPEFYPIKFNTNSNYSGREIPQMLDAILSILLLKTLTIDYLVLEVQ